MSQKHAFLTKWVFWKFFSSFSVTVLGKDLWFFALRSVTQEASFELSKSTFRKVFRFFNVRGDPYPYTVAVDSAPAL